MPTLKPIPLNIRNDDDKRTCEVLIYEPIGGDGWGFGLDAKTFAQNLKSFGDVDEIEVKINSPGGEVSDGMAIFNTLVQHKAQVNVSIDGIAASAASFIAQAASPGKLSMAENALMMIHLASGMTWGNHFDHAKTAEILQQFDSTIAKTYAARSGRKEATFLSLMEAETWMTAQETVDHKLADTITAAKKVGNFFDLGLLNKYRKAPKDLAERFAINADHDGHGITKCSCGDIISQCRCAGDKEETVVYKGCDKCKQALREQMDARSRLLRSHEVNAA